MRKGFWPITAIISVIFAIAIAYAFRGAGRDDVPKVEGERAQEEGAVSR